MSGKNAESVSERRRFFWLPICYNGKKEAVRMVKSQIHAEINADLAAVWALVTDVSRAGWRSDVKKIEVVQAGSQFIEYARTARRRPLPLRPKHPYKRYEFTMENKHLSGRWTGRFAGIGGRAYAGRIYGVYHGEKNLDAAVCQAVSEKTADTVYRGCETCAWRVTDKREGNAG